VNGSRHSIVDVRIQLGETAKLGATPDRGLAARERAYATDLSLISIAAAAALTAFASRSA
jgi:hypothetical protein